MINSMDLRALLVAATLVQCGSTHALAVEAKTAIGNAQVSIDNFAFTPNVLQVKAGTTITFVNHDDIPHSIVATDGTFHSKALDTDQTYSLTPDKPGEIAYFCGLHPHMKAKIVIVP